jgi:hypothetical protein
MPPYVAGLTSAGLVWQRTAPTRHIRIETRAAIHSSLEECSAEQHPVFYEDEVEVDIHPIRKSVRAGSIGGQQNAW